VLCLLSCCSKSKSSLPTEKSYKKNPMVKFKIADDDEDEAAVETSLLPPSKTDNRAQTAKDDTTRV